FQVTEETKAMVLRNICFMLNSFLQCSAYENVIFCWVMHEQSIIDAITGALDTKGCRVINVSLTVSEGELRSRLSSDVEKGIRSADVIGRSVARIGMYQALDTIKVDTDGKSISEIADEITSLQSGNDCSRKAGVPLKRSLPAGVLFDRFRYIAPRPRHAGIKKSRRHGKRLSFPR
ncbi:MAG: hypothetical protein CW338_08420, partial [Clostridiales bacterium]|nr:hypothetical protein [Clostridiales bacterium]